jgi:hypothetical protein
MECKVKFNKNGFIKEWTCPVCGNKNSLQSDFCSCGVEVIKVKNDSLKTVKIITKNEIDNVKINKIDSKRFVMKSSWELGMECSWIDEKGEDHPYYYIYDKNEDKISNDCYPSNRGAIQVDLKNCRLQNKLTVYKYTLLNTLRR